MWLIFGSRGWIGQQFCELLRKDGINYECSAYRMDNLQAIETELESKRPSRVISFIGRTHGPGCSTIDYLEQGRPQLIENVRDNLFAPVGMAILCSQLGIHFTYLGTGCIFTYPDMPAPGMKPDTQAAFKEEDEPNFFGSGYSIVKGFTDRLMHLFGNEILNLRIRMPITKDLSHPRNFIYKIVHYSKICSIENSMTVLDDLLPVMLDMIKNGKTGTYNLCNPGTISHNTILDMYKHYIDPAFTYQNFTLEEQAQILKADRSNNLMDTTKLESEYDVLDITRSIERLFRTLRADKK